MTRDLAQDGAIAIVFFGILGLALAVGASELGCGTTDGSFEIDAIGADPSAYCDVTHFPGLPDTLGSFLVVGAVYLGPVLVLSLGIFASALTRREKFFRAAVLVAGALTIVALVLSLGAHVDYQGAG